MIDSLTYVTSNPGKAMQLNRYLDFSVIHRNIDLVEIQSLDLSTVVEHKAREAYTHVLSPVLIEDASLQFRALGKLPGPLIKWFLAELGTEGLCRLLDASPDRSALASAQYCLYDGQAFHIFSGEREGSISSTPRGSNGFGWDAVFIPAGHSRTWAEMADDESWETSMRAIALNKLAVYLKEY